MTRRPHWYIAVALDGHGSHPAAWRTVAQPADGLFDGSVALRHTLLAETAGVDLATFDDRLLLQERDGEVRGRVDALLLAAKLGPLTARIGLAPAITTTHTEPFHVAKNVATLDWVSAGRGAWRVAVSTSGAEAAQFGRKDPEPIAELHDEAADAVEVACRLWDSWEDDAIIRDRATGRFIDRDKVHYIDFVGPRFSVRGPSIVPRSPQGQPLVAIDANDEASIRLAGRCGDIVLVDAPNPEDGARRRDAVLTAVEQEGRDPAHVTVLATIDVVVGETDAEAAERAAALDAHLAWERPAARAFVAAAASTIVERLHAWGDAVDGVHLRPAVLDRDLPLLAYDVLPRLRASRPLRSEFVGGTLRDRLGLPRPASRYGAAP